MGVGSAKLVMMNETNQGFLAILQARMSSTRLPGKVMMPLNGIPMIGRQILRIKRASKIDRLVVATSELSSDDLLVDYLNSKGIETFRGNLQNVYSRFVGVTDLYHYQNLIRLTADCPLAMPEIIDEMINVFQNKSIDYLSNSLERSFPNGLDVEIFTRDALLRLGQLNLNPSELEHVTLGFHHRKDIFKVQNFPNSRDYSSERWCVDYPEDFEFIKRIYSYFSGREDRFTFGEVLACLAVNPQIANTLND